MKRLLVRSMLVFFLTVLGLDGPAAARDLYEPGEEGEITYSNCWEGPDWNLAQHEDCGTVCLNNPDDNCGFFQCKHKWHYYQMVFTAENPEPPPYGFWCNISWRVHEGCCWGEL